jgi:hypothetical protein
MLVHPNSWNVRCIAQLRLTTALGEPRQRQCAASDRGSDTVLEHGGQNGDEASDTGDSDGVASDTGDGGGVASDMGDGI